MSGGSVIMSGTAWRCMFEPMRARLASLCSRNGISAVATETICAGFTSMYWTRLGSASTGWPPGPAAEAGGVDELARPLVHGLVRLGDGELLLLGGVQVDDLVGDLAALTTR